MFSHTKLVIKIPIYQLLFLCAFTVLQENLIMAASDYDEHVAAVETFKAKRKLLRRILPTATVLDHATGAIKDARYYKFPDEIITPDGVCYKEELNRKNFNSEMMWDDTRREHHLARVATAQTKAPYKPTKNDEIDYVFQQAFERLLENSTDDNTR